MKKETPCIIIYWRSANYNEKCKEVFLCYHISITYIVYHILIGIVSIVWYLLPNMFFSRKSHLYRYMFLRVPIGVGSYQFDIQTLRFPSKPSICLFFMLLLRFIVISLELYRPRWLTRQVIHNAIDPAHLIDNSGHHLI